MMRNRLLVCFLGIALLAVSAGIAAAQAPYAAPTVSNVDKNFSDGGLKFE